MLIDAFIYLGFFVIALISGVHFFGLRSVRQLRGIPSSEGKKIFISIIVAARNEEVKIESALLSLLALDYPSKEVIVVNDRSTDQTLEILRRVSMFHPSLSVLNVTELPPGWLGKNHAHFLGAKAARGEVFLFTDADVVMDKTALTRAFYYFEKNQLDHMAVVPQVERVNWLFEAAMIGFQFFFNLFTRLWKVKDLKSGAFVGIGAFNMVRRSAYEKIGTHEAIRMRPDDDMRLGERLKKAGFRSDVLFGVGMLRVEWYSSIQALIEGLMKNAFSGANYHLSLVVLGSLIILIFLIGPFAGAIFLKGPSRWWCLLSSCLLVFCAAQSAHTQRQRVWLALGFPFTMALLVYIAWKASLRTLLRGGIEWRGTFYSLKDLKSNRG